LDLFFESIIREQNDFHSGIQQDRDDIRLQEIHDRQAMVGADENSGSAGSL
jgi:hypothetical protein